MPREAPRPPALEQNPRGSTNVRTLYYGLPWSLSLPKRLDAHNSCRSQDCRLLLTRFLAHIIRYSSYHSLDTFDSIFSSLAIKVFYIIIRSKIWDISPGGHNLAPLSYLVVWSKCSNALSLGTSICHHVMYYYRSLQPNLSRNLNEALSQPVQAAEDPIPFEVPRPSFSFVVHS